MKNEIIVLKELAKEYYALASLDVNKERLKLHQKVNDLKMERPVVLIDELPWNEMNVDGCLDTVCTDPVLKKCELYLRMRIFQFNNFSGDMVLPPYIPVRKIFKEEGGLKKLENTLQTDSENHIVSHEYEDQLKEENDLSKIEDVKIIYDEKQTMENYHKIGEALSDVIPVKLKGFDHYTVTTWDDISEFRGVTPLLMDLALRPDFMHKITRRLTDNYISRLEQLEKLGAFDSDPHLLHCTPVATNDLEKSSQMTRKNIWGRGAAQILASASKEMRMEFDIEYMKETVGQCGLVYYGCCEPLDTMIDIVEQIPNIRKIGVTPWANPEVAADAINKKYVFSSKPNPASVCSKLDEDALKKEIKMILDAGRKNGCNMDITLKDISTIGYDINNIIRWEQIVMEMVNSC